MGRRREGGEVEMGGEWTGMRGLRYAVGVLSLRVNPSTVIRGRPTPERSAFRAPSLRNGHASCSAGWPPSGAA